MEHTSRTPRQSTRSHFLTFSDRRRLGLLANSNTTFLRCSYLVLSADSSKDGMDVAASPPSSRITYFMKKSGVAKYLSAWEIKLFSDSRTSLHGRKMSPMEDNICTVCTAHQPPPPKLKLKHVVLLLGQLGHLLADRPHKRRGGEAAQGHVVHVLNQ